MWCFSYCEYVLQRLEHLPKNKKEMRATLRLLVYFSHLLTLFEAPFILRANRADTAFGTSYTWGFVSTRLLIRAPLVLTRATGGEEESVPHLAGVPAVVQSRLLSTFCERQVGKSGRTRCVHRIPPWMAGVCPLTRSGLAVLSARNCCVTSCCCTCVRWL